MLDLTKPVFLTDGTPAIIIDADYNGGILFSFYDRAGRRKRVGVCNQQGKSDNRNGLTVLQNIRPEVTRYIVLYEDRCCSVAADKFSTKVYVTEASALRFAQRHKVVSIHKITAPN